MQNNIFGKQTLKPEGIRSLPLWRGVYAFFAIIVSLLVIAEVLARTPLGYYVPPPSVGVDSFEFDTKVYYLEQSIRQHGPLDCLILGDSMTNNGPDPRLIEEAYKAETGSSIHCFNFGLPALFLDSSGPLAEALVNRFHPKLLILMLSPRDFETSVDFPVSHIASTDWAGQNIGSPCLRGWAVNSLYGYRYFLSFLYWLTPSNRMQILDTWHSITREGLTPLHGLGALRQLPPPGLTFQRTYAPAQQGFDQLLELKDNGQNILIIDALIRPDEYSAHQQLYFQPYVEYMQSTLAEHDIPFWLTKSLSDSIRSDGWYDLQHINEKGIPVLSAWIGKQLSREYPVEFFE